MVKDEEKSAGVFLLYSAFLLDLCSVISYLLGIMSKEILSQTIVS